MPRFPRQDDHTLERSQADVARRRDRDAIRIGVRAVLRGGNQGGNEVGTNRVAICALESARVIWKSVPVQAIPHENATCAQARTTFSGAEGRRFESCTARSREPLCRAKFARGEAYESASDG